MCSLRLLLLVWLGCGASIAWAEDYSVTPQRAVDLSTLTSEWKQAVPSLQGCAQTEQTITCRRETGDFTVQERAALNTTLGIHNASIREQRIAQQRQQRQSARQKLLDLGLTGTEFEALFGTP